MKRIPLLKFSLIALCIAANLAIDIPRLYESYIMSEVAENGVAYLRRQMAYASAHRYHGDGSWKDIGFDPRNCIRDTAKGDTGELCKTAHFRYAGTRGIDAPRSGVAMSLLDSLHGCPAGAYWEAFVFRGSLEYIEPNDIDCIKLLPDFKERLKEFQITEDPIEIAAPLQAQFAALFDLSRFSFSDSTIPNLWPETMFHPPVDSSMLANKINENPKEKYFFAANFHETEWFKYEEIPGYMEILFRRIHTGMRATLKKELGDCPAGTTWEGHIVADIENMDLIANVPHWGKNLCQIMKAPTNKACLALTPHIHDLNTCDTLQWKKDLDDYRTKLFTEHQDSIKRRISFYKDSIKNKEIADSIVFAEHDKCEKENDSSANCPSILASIKIGGLSNFSENIEDYNYHTPLNVWEILQGDDYYFANKIKSDSESIRINHQTWLKKYTNNETSGCPVPYAIPYFNDIAKLLFSLNVPRADTTIWKEDSVAKIRTEHQIWSNAAQKMKDAGFELPIDATGITSGLFATIDYQYQNDSYYKFFCFKPNGNASTLDCDRNDTLRILCLKNR